MAITIGFIAGVTLIFCFVGQPATVLVVVGAINGFILPIALDLAGGLPQDQDHGGRLPPPRLVDLTWLAGRYLHGLRRD